MVHAAAITRKDPITVFRQYRQILRHDHWALDAALENFSRLIFRGNVRQQGWGELSDDLAGVAVA